VELAMLNELEALPNLVTSPFFLIGFAFQVWMFIDACRRREWIWAGAIFFFSVFAAAWYFMQVYRQSADTVMTRGFEFPGAVDRRRITELEGKLRVVDHAVHHLQLGDIYFQQGKLEKALESFRAAHERDPKDIDVRAHLGQCLLRLGKASEARPLLEGACRENLRHDYGHTLMALAECLTLQGEKEHAVKVWRLVLEGHSYARARCQFAALLVEIGEKTEAVALLRELVEDDRHAPKYDRRRDKVWVRQAGRLLATLG
jgi:hypothetical protein